MDALIKIEGKPITKLIEVVSNGIGTLYRPRAIRKEADARAYEIRVIEKAKAEALAAGRLIEVGNLERINDRIIAKEIKRQNNIDDVVEIAASQFNEDTQVSDQYVSEDWSSRFFNIVQDISSDDMKNLWGRILAGETEQPGSYSMRTLETLRNMSKDEADLFVRIAPLILQTDICFIFKVLKHTFKAMNIKYLDIVKLIEVGLLQSDTNLGQFFNTQPTESSVALFCGKLALLLNIKANTPTFQIPAYGLTRAGEELYSLLNVEPSFVYLKEVSGIMEKKGLTVKCVKIKQINEDGTFSYHLPEIDL